MKSREKVFYLFFIVSVVFSYKGVIFAEEANQESSNYSSSQVSLVVTKKEVNYEQSSKKAIVPQRTGQRLPQTNESVLSSRSPLLVGILVGSLLVLLKIAGKRKEEKNE